MENYLGPLQLKKIKSFEKIQSPLFSEVDIPI